MWCRLVPARKWEKKLILFEDESQYGKLHKHGNSHHNHRRNESVNAHLHTAPEQDYVQKEIDSVAAREANETLYGRFRAESELTCEVEINKKADDIAYGIRQIHLYEQLQKVVNTIVYACRKTTIKYESHELSLAGITVFHCVYFLFQYLFHFFLYYMPILQSYIFFLINICFIMKNYVILHNSNSKTGKKQ